MSGAALRVDAVTAGYGPLTVLGDLSLDLMADEILLVLGANGSGKSTLLRTVIGLTRITAGRLMLGGQDITSWPAHRRAAAGIGYVPQTGNVFAGLTVQENLRMGGFLQADGGAAALGGVYDLFPHLRQRLGTRAGALSGGERRMLSIALTMVASPRLLLLDEPSSDLAPAMIDVVFAAIGRIRREHRLPVMLVEQNVARGLAIAGRVVVMVRGRAAATMPAAAVRPGDLHALFLDGSVGATPADAIPDHDRRP